MKTIVNSWNEWDPLKHVILGRADGCCIPPSEPAVDGKVPEDSLKANSAEAAIAGVRDSIGPVNPKMIPILISAKTFVVNKDNDIIAAINSFFIISLLIILLITIVFTFNTYFSMRKFLLFI